MVNPSTLTNAVNNMFSFSGNFAGLIMLLGQCVLYSILVGGIVLVVYIMTSYNIKVDTYPMYGSGKDGVFSVAKKKTNRIKWAKNKTVWKPLFPLLNKKEIEPFDSEYIYPGNQIYAFDLNDSWIPGRINITQTEDHIRAEVNPVPYYIRNWQTLQHKKNAIEFAETDWWSENKLLVMSLICGLAILGAVALVVYLTYSYAGQIIPALNNIASTFQQAQVIPGVVPN